MYRSMLFLHWKQINIPLIPLILAAYALPLLSVQGLGTPPGMDSSTLEAYRIVAGAQIWLPVFPLLAAVIGVTLALSAWNWDHQLGHVHALSLPVPRWRYALLKMGAGATLALLPAAGLWMGAHVATSFVDLPTGLNAYPNQLALRFLAATLVAYGLLFAMAAGTVKTTVWIISVVIGFFILGNVVTDFLVGYFPVLYRTNLLELALEALIRAPGPLQVFTGNWMLIDV
jgi:hypothetical protein